MRRPWVVRTIVAVLTVWALITIVPDITRVVKPLAALGLTADFGGRIVAVEPGGPSAAAGVHGPDAAGHRDRIDFGHTPSASLFALYSGLGGRPYVWPGRRLDVVLIGRGAAVPRPVTIVAAERDPPLLERAGLLLDEVLGMAFIALGAILAWNFPRRRDVFGFFLYAIWFNPGQDYVFYALLPRAAWIPQEMLSAALQALGLAGFVVFALRFPTDRSEGWRAPVERFLPLLVIGLSVTTAVGSGAEFGRPNETAWHIAFWIKVAVYPFVAAAFLTKLHLLAPIERQRLRLVIFGCIPGLFFYLLAESVDATALWQPVFDQLAWTPPGALINCGYLMNALVPISIGNAVVRRHVLPIDFIVNRGLTLAIVWAIVAMSVEATVLTTHALLAENHVVSTLVLAAVLVAAAPVLERLKEFVNVGVDRLLFARLHRAKRDLESAAQRLGAVTSTAEIETALVAEPCAQLRLAAAALFARDDDGTFRLRAQHAWPAGALTAIDARDPLLEALPEPAGNAKPRSIPADRPGLPGAAARPQLALTLAPDAYIDALALFSGHTNGSALTPDEALVIARFVRDCGAHRAHAATLELRRELGAFRRAAIASSDAAPDMLGAGQSGVS